MLPNDEKDQASTPESQSSLSNLITSAPEATSSLNPMTFNLDNPITHAFMRAGIYIQQGVQNIIPTQEQPTPQVETSPKPPLIVNGVSIPSLQNFNKITKAQEIVRAREQNAGSSGERKQDTGRGSRFSCL